MSKNEKESNLGYQPQKTDGKGYQPQFIPTSDPKPQGGNVPTSTGDNPTNIPTPPGDE